MTEKTNNRKTKEPSHLWRTREADLLFEAILKLRNKNEAAKFFRDLLTVSEIKEFSKRWQIAKLLDKGLSYAEIAEETKASTTTVARVAHWLNHGMGGYRFILSRIEKD